MTEETQKSLSAKVLIYKNFMKFSQLFTKTTKKAPKDEASINARLLIRAGFIDKNMAGVYAYLPLGLRVLKKIKRVIGQEMNKIGGQELLLTSLQDPAVWKKTGRWDDKEVNVWFKTTLANKNEVGLANTHEEAITKILTRHVSSYRDLPKYIYQFQAKFRNELRAKSGLIRTREFIMKDLYSFSRDEKEHKKFYETVQKAYVKIFNRVGIGDSTFLTFAGGGSFSKYSHEFQTLCESGEDEIYVDEKKKLAINKEIYSDETLKETGLKREDLVKKKAIEVGNIFSLGTKYAQALGLNFKDEGGKEKSVIMGSYGIGLGRLLGTVVEQSHDERGIIWPQEIAPFKYHLVSLQPEGGKVASEAEKIYRSLHGQGVEVLYDDRKVSAGIKFADSDLMGIPIRVVVSQKTLAQESAELKDRKSGKVKFVKLKSLTKEFKKN